MHEHAASGESPDDVAMTAPRGAGVAAAPSPPRQQIVDFTGTRAAGDVADFLVHDLPVSLQAQILNFDTVRMHPHANLMRALIIPRSAFLLSVFAVDNSTRNAVFVYADSRRWPQCRRII
jgi:hypothetical protein